MIVEYVRVRKRRVTEDQEVRAPVRREIVTIQQMGAAGGRLDPPLVHGAVDAGRSQDTAP